MKHKLFIVLICICLFFINSCNTIEPPVKIDEAKLKLELVDVSCYEAWIRINTGNLQLPAWLYYRINGGGNNSVILHRSDTLIYHTGYIPQSENTFILSSSSMFNPDNTSELRFNTLDTTLENYTWKLDTLGSTQSDISGIWGSNSNDVWVVGTFTSSGLTSPIAHYNGNSWTYKRPNNINSINGIRAGNLFGIKGIDENNIWVVGNGEDSSFPNGDSIWTFVAYYNGIEWNNISPNIPDERLFSVWAANNNEVWAVGTNGTILFYNGNNWTKQESGTTLQLCAIDGLNDKNIYAVGYSYDYNEGVILHFNGNNWEKVYLNNGIEPSPMRDVRVFSERKIWVVGLITYEFDGERWNIQGINGNNLLSVDGDGYNDIFMGGFQGKISHFNGLNLNKLFVNSIGSENASIYDIKVFQDKIYFAGRGGIGFDKRGLVYTASK